MSDNFTKDYQRAIRTAESIENDIKARDEASAKKISTSKLEATIRGQLKQLSGELELLGKSFASFENNPSAYNLTTREIEKRRTNLLSLQERYQNITEKASNNPNSAVIFNGMKNQAQTFNQEYDVQNMTTKDLLVAQKDIISQQDEQIEVLSGVVTNIHKGQLLMNQELDYQNKELLPKLEKGVDQNTQKMVKINRRLAALLKSSSNCCLYIVILLQIVALIFLILNS